MQKEQSEGQRQGSGMFALPSLVGAGEPHESIWDCERRARGEAGETSAALRGGESRFSSCPGGCDGAIQAAGIAYVYWEIPFHVIPLSGYLQILSKNSVFLSRVLSFLSCMGRVSRFCPDSPHRWIHCAYPPKVSINAYWALGARITLLLCKVGLIFFLCVCVCNLAKFEKRYYSISDHLCTIDIWGINKVGEELRLM